LRTAYYTRQFKRDSKLAQKRRKDTSKLKNIMTLLTEDRPLPEKYKEHALKGEFEGYRECHIESDWLLIYKLDPSEIYFVRTGTHSDLFG